MCWTFDNYISLISIIFVFTGGLFGLYQWFTSNKIKQAEFIDKIIEKIRFDDSIAETMLMIDYDLNWYDDNFHNSKSNIEVEIDKLLSYLAYICYLKKTFNITKKEFSFLEYELARVCISPSVQRYLWNLYHFSKKNNTVCSFNYLINYGIDNKLFHESFKDTKSSKYKKYKKLNF